MLDQYSTTDPSSNSNQLLDSVSNELEQSFTAAAIIAKEMNDNENSQLAAKRAFSYNPDAKTILDLFPQYEPIISEINALKNKNTKLINEDLNNPDSWGLLGNCYLALGDFPNALTAYWHSTKINPDSPNANLIYAIGITYAHFKHNDYALKHFQKVLDINSNFVFIDDIKFRIALLQRMLGRFDIALKMFEEIKRSPPNELLAEDIMMQIAYTHQLSGKNDKAYQIYIDLHQRFPNALKLTQQYCLFLFLQYKDSKIEMVKSVVDGALQSNPNDPILLMIAARIAMKLDDMNAAYSHYRICTTYYSDSPYFWCGLGVLYYKNEQTQDAVVAFQRGLYLKSEMPEAWLNIGLIFEQLNNFDNAIKVYQTGEQKCPNCQQFNERLNFLNSQKNGHRKFRSMYKLIDIDDSKFITPIPEQFSNDYISAVPILPSSCFKIDSEIADKFATLSTYPKSIFV